MSQTKVSRSAARRIALAAQGLDRPRPARAVGVRELRRAIRELGLVQLDFVNVLVPAHYLVLFSRLGPYLRSRLDDLVYRRREFTEQWAHEASIVPVETWPLLRHRMAERRLRPYGFESLLERHPGYAEQVLAEVRSRGPLIGDDLAVPEGVARRIPGAWVGTVPRAVLEAHFARGLVAVADRRPNFARVYDLAERVLPDSEYRREVGPDEAQRELLRLAARAHGVGTASDLADYYRMPVRVAAPRLAELVAAGELALVRVEGWREPAYLHREARQPRRVEAAALLAPFDPLVFHRPRTARLFDFDYRLEVFVPRTQRRFGCYVLPFLLGERLVARVDLKSDRPARRLVVLGTFFEDHVKRPADGDRVARGLAGELLELAGWLELEEVVVEGRSRPARDLARALRSVNGP